MVGRPIRAACSPFKENLARDDPKGISSADLVEHFVSSSRPDNVITTRVSITQPGCDYFHEGTVNWTKMADFILAWQSGNKPNFSEHK